MLLNMFLERLFLHQRLLFLNRLLCESEHCKIRFATAMKIPKIIHRNNQLETTTFDNCLSKNILVATHDQQH